MSTLQHVGAFSETCLAIIEYMGESDEVPDLRFELTDDLRELLEVEQMRFIDEFGYQPAPNAIDNDRLNTLSNPEELASPHRRPVGAHEAARVVETARVLAERISAIESRELEFNPFLGEMRDAGEPNLSSIRAVIEGESFVSAVGTAAQAAQAFIQLQSSDISAAQHLAEERAEELMKIETLASQNYKHALQRITELDASAGNPVRGRDVLHALYGFDAIAAKSVATRARIHADLYLLNQAVAGFGEFWGNVSDSVHSSYANLTSRRRWRRRALRRLSQVSLAASIALITLLLGELVGVYWAFGGSAVLAGILFMVELRFDSRRDDAARQSQLKDLVWAVERSGILLTELIRRESQLNNLRALRGLPPVKTFLRAAIWPNLV